MSHVRCVSRGWSEAVLDFVEWESQSACSAKAGAALHGVQSLALSLGT